MSWLPRFSTHRATISNGADERRPDLSGRSFFVACGRYAVEITFAAVPRPRPTPEHPSAGMVEDEQRSLTWNLIGFAFAGTIGLAAALALLMLAVLWIGGRL